MSATTLLQLELITESMEITQPDNQLCHRRRNHSTETNACELLDFLWELYTKKMHIYSLHRINAD